MHVPHKSSHGDLPQSAAALLERMRARGPRVHCITNAVAQNFTANTLLAAWCTPSMTLDSEEIAAFVSGADALLVNLGTLDRERREATEIAVETASRKNIPWVLDPVFVDRSAPRAEYARRLLDRGPGVVRLNRVEFSTLADGEPTSERLAAFARTHACVVALSGETDLVGDDTRLARIANGHALMAKVTAMGCATSALTAACLAVEDDAWRAAASALVIVGVAGELAAEKAKGPGSFAAGIIDALFALDSSVLSVRARVAA